MEDTLILKNVSHKRFGYCCETTIEARLFNQLVQTYLGDWASPSEELNIKNNVYWNIPVWDCYTYLDGIECYDVVYSTILFFAIIFGFDISLNHDEDIFTIKIKVEGEKV